MKVRLTLNTSEKELLLRMSIDHEWRDVRVRAAALLQLAGGEHPNTIAEKLGVSHQSIYNWRRAWEERGMAGLIIGHKGGRPPALPAAMAETAVAVASQEALTLRGIAKRVEDIHGCPVPCTLETIGTVLKSRGFSFKRTRWSLKKKGVRSVSSPSKRNSTA